MRSNELEVPSAHAESLLAAYRSSAECGQLAVTKMLLEDYGGPGGLWKPPRDLTDAEGRSLKFMAQGFTKEEAAVRCGVTPESAKLSKFRLYRKLGLVASSPMRAVRTGIEHDLLPVRPVEQTEQLSAQLGPYELLLADVMSRNIPSAEARRFVGSASLEYKYTTNAMNQLLDVLGVPVGDLHREARGVREAREGAAIMRLYGLGIFQKGLTLPSALRVHTQ